MARFQLLGLMDVGNEDEVVDNDDGKESEDEKAKVGVQFVILFVGGRGEKVEIWQEDVSSLNCILMRFEVVSFMVQFSGPVDINVCDCHHLCKVMPLQS